jgi:hypothetical protein
MALFILALSPAEIVSPYSITTFRSNRSCSPLHCAHSIRSRSRCLHGVNSAFLTILSLPV